MNDSIIAAIVDAIVNLIKGAWRTVIRAIIIIAALVALALWAMLGLELAVSFFFTIILLIFTIRFMPTTVGRFIAISLILFFFAGSIWVNEPVSANIPLIKEAKQAVASYAHLEVANFLRFIKVTSVFSEKNDGTFGTIHSENGKNVSGYDAIEFPKKLSIVSIPDGTRVYILLNSQLKNEEGREGFLKVRLSDKAGNFWNGPLVYVPIRNLVRDEKKTALPESKTVVQKVEPSSSVATPNTQRLNGQMVDADLHIDGNQYTGNLTLTGDLFAFNGRDRNGSTLSLAGARDKNSVWTGSWNRNRELPKNFLLRFTETNHFSGEVYTENGKVEFSVVAIAPTITSAR